MLFFLISHSKKQKKKLKSSHPQKRK